MSHYKANERKQKQQQQEHENKYNRKDSMEKFKEVVQEKILMGEIRENGNPSVYATANIEKTELL